MFDRLQSEASPAGLEAAALESAPDFASRLSRLARKVLYSESGNDSREQQQQQRSLAYDATTAACQLYMSQLASSSSGLSSNSSPAGSQSSPAAAAAEASSASAGASIQASANAVQAANQAAASPGPLICAE